MDFPDGTEPLDFLCDLWWLCTNTLKDILYDFDEDRYQYVDPFQSWHLYGHAEHESITRVQGPWLTCRKQAFLILVPSISHHASSNNDAFSRRRRSLSRRLLQHAVSRIRWDMVSSRAN